MYLLSFEFCYPPSSSSTKQSHPRVRVISGADTTRRRELNSFRAASLKSLDILRRVDWRRSGVTGELNLLHLLWEKTRPKVLATILDMIWKISSWSLNPLRDGKITKIKFFSAKEIECFHFMETQKQATHQKTKIWVNDVKW